MSIHQRALCLLAGMAVLGGCHPLSAQVQRMRSADRTAVGVEVAKLFIGDSGLSWYTSVLRGRVFAPVGDRTAFLADWGVSFAGTDFGSDATLANPEVGLALLGQGGDSRGYVSVVLPLAQELGDDDVSAGTAFLTDFSWIDRFSDQLWSVNVAATPSTVLGGNGRTRGNLEVVASLIVPDGDEGPDLFSRYVFGASHDTETLRLRGDVEGFAIISQGGFSLSERTTHQLVFGVDGLDGGPGFFVRLPIDDDLDVVDVIVGASFTF